MEYFGADKEEVMKRKVLYSWLTEKGFGYTLIVVGIVGGLLTLFYDLIIGRPSISVGIVAKVGFLASAGIFLLGIDYLRWWKK